MFEAIVLGIIQGATEFIPVSSSGHLLLLPNIFGWEEQSTTFDVFLHGGTLCSLIIYYRKILLNLYQKAIAKEKEAWEGIVKIIIATIPAAAAALAMKLALEDQFKSAELAIFNLIIIGIIFILIDIKLKLGKEASTTNILDTLKGVKYKDALLIGLFQPLALLRGMSRSGIVIIGGITQKLDLKQAVDFSFLIGIPIIALAFAGDLLEIIVNGLGEEKLLHLIIGFITAFISGLIAIQIMLKIINTTGLKWFGVYRIILGLIVAFILLN